MAMDKMLESVVLSYPASRVSEGLQSIFQVWHGQSVGFTGAVAPRGGRGCLLLSGRRSRRCHAERAQCGEGAQLPWLTGGRPAGSARAQQLQRGASALLPGHQLGPRDLSHACEGPEGKKAHHRFCSRRSEEASVD